MTVIGAAVFGAGAAFAIELAIVHLIKSGETHVLGYSAGHHDTAGNSEPLWTCGMHPQVIQDHPGTCPICHMKLVPVKNAVDESSAGIAGGERKVLYYWDPMLGASSIAHAPGRSAMNNALVPVYEDEQRGGPTVKIDPTIIQNIGVRTAEVKRGTLAITIRAFGMLEPPEPAVYEVNLKVNGWVEKLYADTVGMHIEKGEPLFDLYSPDLQIAEEELIGGVKTMKGMDAKSADSVRAESQAMVDSARQKLHFWGVSDQEIDAIASSMKAPPTVAFRSLVEGDLADKSVVQGSAVQAGTKLLRIEDHSTLWLNIQVYEPQIAAIALGQTVEAAVDGVPGETFTGPITFINPHFDHMSRTVTVRVMLDNAKHELRPGMYAMANIFSKHAANSVLVPREAVIDTGTRQIVFVAESEGHFDPRRVRMGMAGDDGQVEILEGLAPGENVVTSGQFLMDVESRTNEAIDKLRRTESPGTKVPTAPIDRAEMAPPVPIAAATMPAAPTAPIVLFNVLVVAHCPMKNADWLQSDNVISNPYFGSMMATCGTVTRTVAAPAEGTPLSNVLENYLSVAKAFDNDKLDIRDIQALKLAVNAIPNEPKFNLHQVIVTLAESKDIESARLTFQSVSAELIHMLDAAASK